MSTENEQQQPRQATEKDLLNLMREYPGQGAMEKYLLEDVQRGIGLEELRATMIETYRHRYPRSDPNYGQPTPPSPLLGSRADDVAGFDEPPKPVKVLQPRARYGRRT
jgi:hypothetical protein